MTVTDKFEKITSWYAANFFDEVNKPNRVAELDSAKLNTIEHLIGEKLPEDFRELYSHYNGESSDAMGSFLGDSLISLDEIISALKVSKALMKPEHRQIVNPNESKRIIEKIIEEFKKHVPVKNRLLFFKEKWYKFKFKCAPNSMGGPYFYKSETTTDKERVIFKLSDESQQKVFTLARQLHALEKEKYNWDELKVTAYGDGRYEAERTDYAFTSNRISSFPEKAIKKRYFNWKWLPLFSDHGGNYIGLDFDPDVEGKRGQVIVFGRDESTMFVIADSIHEFLDLTLKEITRNPSRFIQETHLHSEWKEIIIPA